MKESVCFILGWTILLSVVVLTAFSAIAYPDAVEDPVDLKVSAAVFDLVSSWEADIWFFTSAADPITTLDDLKADECACWGIELFEKMKALYQAAGIEGEGVRLIGTGNNIFTGMEKPPRLFVTWASQVKNLQGCVRLVFVQK